MRKLEPREKEKKKRFPITQKREQFKTSRRPEGSSEMTVFFTWLLPTNLGCYPQTHLYYSSVDVRREEPATQHFLSCLQSFFLEATF